MNRLLKEFEHMQGMIKQFKGGALAKMMRRRGGGKGGLGGLGSLMEKLPTQMAGKASDADLARAEKDIRRKEGIINSMTPLERRKPELLKATRKRRIAAGAGVQVQEVNRLLKEFEQMQGMMKQMKGGGLMKMMKKMGGMKGMPKMPGMG